MYKDANIERIMKFLVTINIWVPVYLVLNKWGGGTRMRSCYNNPEIMWWRLLIDNLTLHWRLEYTQLKGRRQRAYCCSPYSSAFQVQSRLEKDAQKIWMGILKLLYIVNLFCFSICTHIFHLGDKFVSNKKEAHYQLLYYSEVRSIQSSYCLKAKMLNHFY